MVLIVELPRRHSEDSLTTWLWHGWGDPPWSSITIAQACIATPPPFGLATNPHRQPPQRDIDCVDINRIYGMISRTKWLQTGIHFPHMIGMLWSTSFWPVATHWQQFQDIKRELCVQFYPLGFHTYAANGEARLRCPAMSTLPSQTE